MTIGYAQYQGRCANYAVEVFDEAIQNRTLPARLGHVWIFCKATVAAPFFIGEKVIITVHAMLKDGSKLKTELSSFLETVARCILCIFSSLSGVVSPEFAANQWRKMAKSKCDYWQDKRESGDGHNQYAYTLKISSMMVNIYFGWRKPSEENVYVRGCYWTNKIFGDGQSITYTRV